MSHDFHYYEPRDGHGLRHDPLNAIVGPRPIGWISTWDGQGRYNLAPYSFFNQFNYRPPIIGFSSIGWKDSVRNIDATGVFVWNLATRPLAEAMNITSSTVPPDVDEFELSGLTREKSRLIDVPRVAESPVSFECRKTDIIQLGGVDGVKVDSWLVLGEVVAVHIDKSLLVDGVYDTAAARPILRAGRRGDYFEITQDRGFEMLRPK